MRCATEFETMSGNRVMAAPPVRAASTSTAARTLGTRNASSTNQVSRTIPRRSFSATRASGGGVGGVQNSQPGGGAGHSGGGFQSAGGTHPGGGFGHPGGGRHIDPGAIMGLVCRGCDSFAAAAAPAQDASAVALHVQRPAGDGN